jgi:ligand-binding sensor domain-containing protein/predicted Ser/Thr protein kinase
MELGKGSVGVLRALFTLVATLSTVLCVTAASHVYRLHQQADLMVYAITEDPRRPVLWLGTNRGLYEFDGMRFLKDVRYPLGSARQIGFTEDGSLWAASREGLVRRQPMGEWEVVLQGSIATIAISGPRVYGRMDHGFVVDLDGTVTPWSGFPRGDLLIDGKGHLNWIDNGLQWWRGDKLLFRAGDYLAAVRDSQGTVWLGDDTRVVKWSEASAPAMQFKRPPLATFSRQGALSVSGRTGEAWFAGDTVRNLTRGTQFEGAPEHKAFPVTAVHEDRRGRMWVARRGLGLVEWREDEGWQRWHAESFGLEPPVQILPHLVVTARALFRWKKGRWQQWAQTTDGFSAVLPLAGGSCLTASFGAAPVVIDAMGRVVRHLKLPTSDDYPVQLVKDRDGEIWANTGNRLLRLAGDEFVVEDVPGLSFEKGPFRNLNLAVDGNGTLWLSWFDKVARRMPQNGWRVVHSGLPPIRSLSVGIPNKLWLLSVHGNVLESTANGMRECRAPGNNLSWVKVDSRGWIWVGATDRIYFTKDAATTEREWLQLGPWNGLVAGNATSLGFVEEEATGAIWIAGAEGVTRLEPRPDWFTDGLEPPIVRSDGQAGSFHIGSIASSWWRQYRFEYRVQPGNGNWLPVRGDEVNRESLGVDSYRLEVRAAAGGEVVIVPLDDTRPFFGMFIWGGVVAGLALAGFLLTRHSWATRARYWAKKHRFLWRAKRQEEAQAMPHRVGEILFGRFKLLRRVSHGGFSTVFEANDTQSPQLRVAMKILRPMFGREGWSREQFAQEVAALRSVDHPGVVKILDSFVTPGGELCVAMAYLDGPTLRNRIDQGPLSRARISSIILGIGDALEEIHRRGIVHRDLKPENVILCGEDERPVLIDFGAAGLAGSQQELVATSLLVGSIQYLAPERLTGRYSAASDIYSFGVMVVEMATGGRLGDLGCVHTETEFLPALRKALVPVTGHKVEVATDLLKQALDANPRRRPPGVRSWAESIAAEFSS